VSAEIFNLYEMLGMFLLAHELLDFQGLRPSKLDSWILDLDFQCEK